MTGVNAGYAKSLVLHTYTCWKNASTIQLKRLDVFSKRRGVFIQMLGHFFECISITCFAYLFPVLCSRRETNIAAYKLPILIDFGIL